ncbi:MAG: DUF2846 domain-containing protein [Rhizomicrobium sp.]|nr:DUF2846 domain-containing protein [Rhizomicrobium sp.]
MKQLVQPALACVVMLFLTACASSGPTFKEMKASIPPVAADSGRLFVYRVAPFLGAGAAVQPPIRIDGVVVGHSVPNGFFYVDHAPGKLKITTSTEVTEDTDVQIDAGQTKYVRTDISLGLLVGRITPSVIDPDTALKELADLHYHPTK